MDSKLEARIARLEKMLNKNEAFDDSDWKSAEDSLNKIMSEVHNFLQEVANFGDEPLYDAAQQIRAAVSVAFMELKNAKRRWNIRTNKFLD